MTEGVKHDGSKLPFDLISPQALGLLAAVLREGALKYGRRNWEAGMDHSRVYAAAQRHLNAYWGGEDLDPETGQPHLAHALCCVMFLTHYTTTGTGKDDRPRLPC